MTATVDVKGKLVERTADFLVCTLPPTTTRDVDRSNRRSPTCSAARSRPSISARRPECCCSSIAGSGAEPDRRRAFGSPYAIGAVWDGNEQQRGTAGILSLLAGGAASGELQSMLEHDGTSAVVPHLCVARPAGKSSRGAHDHLGTRSVGEGRLRLLRHVLQAVRSRRARASGRSRALRRRTHDDSLAGIREWSDRERQASRGGSQGAVGEGRIKLEVRSWKVEGRRQEFCLLPSAFCLLCVRSHLAVAPACGGTPRGRRTSPIGRARPSRPSSRRRRCRCRPSCGRTAAPGRSSAIGAARPSDGANNMPSATPSATPVKNVSEK